MYELGIGNTFIWLSAQGKDDIEHIHVLFNGEVKILKTINTITLYRSEVQEDLLNLPYNDFISKYDFPDIRDLYNELRNGIMTGKYPALFRDPKKQIKIFQEAITKELSKIRIFKAEKDAKVRFLEYIMAWCDMYSRKIETKDE